ncbi:MAG: hypothetical protein ACX932_04315 [Gammaproteobacteria bacterium]
MNAHILDSIEQSTEALLRQQEQLKALCIRLQQERDKLLAKNQEATQRIHHILEQLRQRAVQPKAYHPTKSNES